MNISFLFFDYYLFIFCNYDWKTKEKITQNTLLNLNTIINHAESIYCYFKYTYYFGHIKRSNQSTKCRNADWLEFFIYFNLTLFALILKMNKRSSYSQECSGWFRFIIKCFIRKIKFKKNIYKSIKLKFL